VFQAGADSETNKTTSKYHSIALVLTGACLLLIPLWALRLISNVHIPFLDLGPRSDEYTALFIFILFCLIDALFFRSCMTTIGHIKGRPIESGEKERAKRQGLESLTLQSRLFNDSFWYVDVPVVIGVSIVLWLSGFSETHFDSLGKLTMAGSTKFGVAFGSDQQHAVFALFLTGITAGATVTHLVVSQLIFGILRTRDLYRRYFLSVP